MSKRDMLADVEANPNPYKGAGMGYKGSVSTMSFCSPSKYGNSDLMDPTKLADEEVNEGFRFGNVLGGV